MLSGITSAGFSTPDTADTGAQPAAAGPRDADPSAPPFASVLATRLASGGTRATAHASGERTTAVASDDGHEDGYEDETTDAAENATGVEHALAALGLPPAALVGAATVASAAPSANVRHVTRDATTLAPALRERLGRVVTRMQDEYGYKVQIAEAGRTQARQDYLFAQGRTRSGPVVTWTRDSAHTRGRAVDVTIDGSYENPAAFARLQQIAEAEGLHTLGARDPGHLQLPHGVAGEVTGGGATRVTVESFGTRVEPALPQSSVHAPSALAPVAAVASVAQVAGVAEVAAVASVAAPGSLSPSDGADASTAGHDARRASAHGATHETSARGRGTDQTSAAAVGQGAARTRGDKAGDGGGRESEADTSGRGARAPHGSGPNAPVAPVSAPAWAAPAASPASTVSDSAQAPSAAPSASPVLGAIAAERIARVLDAQQAAAPRTVSHLTLRVERAEGGEDRIRLDLRGRAVDARIDVNDVGTADQLTARTAELRAALAQHGFTTDDVRVHAGADVALAAGARDPSRDQSARDDQRPSDGAPHDRAPHDGAPRDGSRGERRASDERQSRRPPADASLDAPARKTPRRTTS